MATAGDASSSGTPITVKYETLVIMYKTITSGIPIYIATGNVLL